MNSITTTNESCTTGVTLASLSALMDDFYKRFPRAETPTAVRCGRQMHAVIRKGCIESTGVYHPLAVLPIFVDETIAYPSYVIEMADGTELVYRGGGLEPIRRETKAELVLA